jgi:hypothetical protein
MGKNGQPRRLAAVYGEGRFVHGEEVRQRSPWRPAARIGFLLLLASLILAFFLAVLILA